MNEDDPEINRRAIQEYILAGGREREWPFIDPWTRNEYKILAVEQIRWERRVSTAGNDSST